MKLNRRQLRRLIESWADTSWSMGEEKIMITDLIKHLPSMMDIDVTALMSQLPNKLLPTRGQERVDRSRFGEYNPDGTYTRGKRRITTLCLGWKSSTSESGRYDQPR